MKIFEEITVIFPEDKELIFLEQLLNIRIRFYEKVTIKFSISKDVINSNNKTVFYLFQLYFSNEENYKNYNENPEKTKLSLELNRFCGPVTESVKKLEFNSIL